MFQAELAPFESKLFKVVYSAGQTQTCTLAELTFSGKKHAHHLK